APIAATQAGKPDCTVNPAIDKMATAFSFRPPGCGAAACTSIRALVVSVSNTDPIPDGAVLYTCNANVAAGATGRFPLTVAGVHMSTPDGAALPNATGVDGAI